MNFHQFIDLFIISMPSKETKPPSTAVFRNAMNRDARLVFNYYFFETCRKPNTEQLKELLKAIRQVDDDVDFDQLRDAFYQKRAYEKRIEKQNTVQEKQ